MTAQMKGISINAESPVRPVGGIKSGNRESTGLGVFQNPGSVFFTLLSLKCPHLWPGGQVRQ